MPTSTEILTDAEAFLNAQPDAAGSPVKIVNGDTIELTAPIRLDPIAFFDLIDLPDASELLPDSLSDVADLQLTMFGVTTDGVVNFTLRLQSGTASRWMLIPGLMEIDAFTLAGTIDQDAIGPPLTGFISVNSRIVGLNTVMDLNLPDLDFSARATNPGDTGSLFEAFGVENEGFRGLTIESMTVAGSARARTAAFSVDISNAFTVALPGTSGDLEVNDIGLEIFYKGGEEGGFTGSLSGTTRVGGIDFTTSAIYDGAETGWTFAGRAESPGSDPVGVILGAFGLSGSPLQSVSVERVEMTFNTLTKNFDFGFAGTITIDSTVADSPTPRIVASAQLSRQSDGTYTRFFSGELTLGDGGSKKIFDLLFDQNGDGSTLVGSYRNAGGGSIPLNDLVAALTGSTDNSLNGLDFSIKDAMFAYQSGGNVVFTMDMDFGIELSSLGNLPLIGTAIPKDRALSLAFQPLFSSGDSLDLEAIQGLLPEEGPSLPDELGNGFELLLALNIAGERTIVPLDLGGRRPDNDLGTPDEEDPGVAGTNSAMEVAPSNMQFLDVEKSLGPLHIGRVGVALRQRELGLMIDGAISVAGLTLSLDGLGALYNMNSKNLQFFLRGMGIQFQRGPVEIAGGFLNLGNDFAGKVKIATAKFEITALGALAEVQGEPSLFLYGLLDYPLGGPAFFFVEGLAVGFGFNRSFTPPADLLKLREFPLVQDAVNNATLPADADPKATVTDQLTRLGSSIQPSLGEYFITVGIKFTSFKLLNSFILATATFGKQFELIILGATTYQNPPALAPATPALARIEMNLEGRFSPAEGFLGVRAELTDKSYLLSNICKIRGGFAFYNWFDGPHAGDFVLTVGGYHPKFKKPAHYPNVSRLSLTYQITEDIFIKGSAYFALTPSALMAGGALEATAKVGPISAWFDAGVDMLITWEPYHYDFHVEVTVGADFGIATYEVSAEVDIWGPEFSGLAVVDIGIKTFEVEFGESDSRGLTPIGWNAFKSAFLPADSEVCSSRIVGGIVYEIERKVGEETVVIPIINPKDLALETNSAIPAGSGSMNDMGLMASADAFGVAPMNLADVGRSEQKIELLREDANGDFIPVDENEFEVLPVTKKYPKGMWGRRIDVDMNAGMIDAVAGYSITVNPISRVTPGNTRTFKRSDFNLEPLSDDSEHAVGIFDVAADGLSFALDTTEDAPTDDDAPIEDVPTDDDTQTDIDELRRNDEERRVILAGHLTGDTASAGQASRAEILNALGFDPAEAVTISENFSEAFVIPPQVVKNA